jgi:hypothetical protein
VLLHFLPVSPVTSSRLNNVLLIRSSVSRAVVRSTEIKQTKTADDKFLYALAQKEFESIPDLISYYQTYDLAVVASSSGATIPLRLGKPLPRPNWRQELEQQTWYQSELTRVTAEQLLYGVNYWIKRKSRLNVFVASVDRRRNDFSHSRIVETIRTRIQHFDLLGRDRVSFADLSRWFRFDAHLDASQCRVRSFLSL